VNPFERSIAQRRWRRILPVAFVMYTISYVDRTNVALALPSMISDLHMDPMQAGGAVGIFFWGYLLLQIPGGYLAQRWSAKKVVSILLASWGICAVATGLISSAWQFCVARFLLGVAEGGVFPATIILLANWFPPAERARANAYWMLCQPLALVVSSPLSGWILGRWDWRILLIVEGVVPFVWLWVWITTIEDRAPATPGAGVQEGGEATGVEAHLPAVAGGTSLGAVRSLADSRVVTLITLCFFLNCGGYGYLFWLPGALTNVKRVPTSWLGVLYAVPFFLAGIGMVLNSRHSDRVQERRLHVALPLLIGGTLLIAGVLISEQSPLASFALVCLAGGAFYSSLGPLWTIPTEYLHKESAGAAAGLVNAIGGLGGYFGPFVVGILNARTGNFRAAFATLGGSLVLAGGIALTLRLRKAPL
jgi:MFS family permease